MAGKTFAVRQLAVSTEREYVFVPLNADVSIGELLDRIDSQRRVAFEEVWHNNADWSYFLIINNNNNNNADWSYFQ